MELAWFDLVPGSGAVAGFVLGWLTGWALFWRSRPLPPAPVSGGDGAGRATGVRPAVAVVIPARDEAAVIGALVTAVVAGQRPGDELLVVDDASSDGTGALAAAAGAEVLRREGAPRPGWAGKPAACVAGAAATSAPILVFLDADVTPRPDLVDRLAARVAATPDALVSVQPWHRTGRLVESISLLGNVVSLMGSGGFTILGRRGHGGRALAFGPVLATRRDLYERSGGHAAPEVRGSVAEDIALGKRYPSVEVFTGRPVVEFRMYPSGVRPILDGWTRGLVVGAASVRWWRGVMCAAWLCSLAGGWTASPWFALASAAQLAVLARRAGRFSPMAIVAYPVLVVVFVACFVGSVVTRVSGRTVGWKGREVAPR